MTATKAGDAEYYESEASCTITIEKKILTPTFAANAKAYDGTTAATGTISLEGIIGDDDVIASGSFAFESEGAGTGKTVNITDITLSGAQAQYYELAATTGTATADITQSSSNDSPRPTPTPTPTPDGSAEIIVNGRMETAATATTETIGDRQVTTVTIDDDKVEKQLEKEGLNAVVTIPVNNNADVIIGKLNGQTVKNMENMEAVLEIKTGNASYTIPASQINIDSILEQLGSDASLEEINVQVTIAKPQDDTARIVEDTANRNNYMLVVRPLEFEITCTSGDRSIEVSHFNGYVERMVAIPDGIDPSKITTGIVLNSDGTFSHVPTTIVLVDGKYYAKINSLTNSTYSVIHNTVTFSDMKDHWAMAEVNDMASRLILQGTGDGKFAPDRDMTRAEFAAVIVRALGLRAEQGDSLYADVSTDQWYNTYLRTASNYALLTGYQDGTFKPNDKITREEAMVILNRAMTLTGLGTGSESQESGYDLSLLTDSNLISGWAEEAVGSCMENGLTQGRSGNRIAPQDNITRAEVAVLVSRLLKNS